MVFKEATDCCAGTAAIYGAPDLVKIAQLLNGKAITGCCAVLPRDTIFTISDATDATALIRFDATSITTATTRVVTVPDANLIIVGTTTCQTLTNKTLTTPTISATGFTNATHAHLAANSGGQITEASISDLQCYLTAFDPTGSPLLDARFWIGSGANVAAELTISGGVTVANTGVATVVTNANLTGCVTSCGNATTTVTNANLTGPVTSVGNATTIIAKAVTVAMLADGTDGELITWDVCGVAATVGAGTCGQVLTSQGACNVPIFAAAGAADNLGNHTATTCLIMGTNAITFGVDAVAPAACVSYHTYLAAGPIYNAISCDIHDFKVNAVSVLAIGVCTINSTCVPFQECCISISPIGTHTQWIPAGSWGTVTTNGAEFAELELATNDIMLQTFNFDTTTSEKIQFWWEPPAEWNAGTITFNTKWTAAGGCACQTFILNLSGHSYTNSDAIDVAICGTENCTNDALITVNDMHISGESCAVTIAGATKGEAVVLQLARDICDTLSVDAKLIGINITYSTDEATAT